MFAVLNLQHMQLSSFVSESHGTLSFLSLSQRAFLGPFP